MNTCSGLQMSFQNFPGERAKSPYFRAVLISELVARQEEAPLLSATLPPTPQHTT